MHHHCSNGHWSELGEGPKHCRCEVARLRCQRRRLPPSQGARERAGGRRELACGQAGGRAGARTAHARGGEGRGCGQAAPHNHPPIHPSTIHPTHISIHAYPSTIHPVHPSIHPSIRPPARRTCEAGARSGETCCFSCVNAKPCLRVPAPQFAEACRFWHAGALGWASGRSSKLRLFSAQKTKCNKRSQEKQKSLGQVNRSDKTTCLSQTHRCYSSFCSPLVRLASESGWSWTCFSTPRTWRQKHLLDAMGRLSKQGIVCDLRSLQVSRSGWSWT